MAVRFGRLVKTFFLSFIRWFVEVTSGFLLGLVYRGNGEELPRINDNILLESAQALAAKIRARKLKSEDLVKCYIDRIREVNPIVNAVVDDRFDEAICEARNVDKLIASGMKTDSELANETPFLGVPFSMKECFKCKGLRQTAGLVLRKDCISSEDANVVALMKNAGAILLGVTNVSELCMWWESDNKVYGRTRNPYNTTRYVGGSSGGEGSLIASAGSVIGVGSDIAGSIRIPSYFNGIFGHKGSTGAVSNEGHYPVVTDSKLSIYQSSGPMCRYATDLLPMFKVLSKTNAKKLKLDEPVDVSKLRFFYMEDGGFGSVPIVSPVHPELKTAMRNVVSYLEKTYKGLKVHKLDIPEFKYGGAIWGCKIVTASSVPFSVRLADNKGNVNLWLELLKKCMFMSDHTLPSIGISFFESFFGGNERHMARMDEMHTLLVNRLADLLGDDGVLIYPPVPTLAQYHNHTVFTPLNFYYTAIFNALGLPVTQCPLGLSKSAGLPLGVQLVANLDCDRLTLAVAVELERAFGGWVSPSLLPL